MPLQLRVCRLDEIIEDELQSFEVAGVTIPILVTKVGGKIFAGSSMCPHEDVSLVGGRLDGTNIVCPGHGYAFDMQSGQCSHDEKLRWRTYTTEIIANVLYVNLL